MTVRQLELEERVFDAEEVDNEIEEAPLAASLKGVESDDVIALYMKEVGSIPLLTHEEEIDLGHAVREGEAAARRLARADLSAEKRVELERAIARGEEARRRFVEANSRLVISIARKYMGRGLPLSDLMQEGNLGLMKAVERFDPDLGHRFSTYATWWIRQAILRSLADQGRTIRLPAHIVDELSRMNRVAKTLAQDLGREPTDEELGEELEVPAERVTELRSLAGQPLSLETPIGEEEESTLAEFIEDEDSPTPSAMTSESIMWERLDDALDSLSPREARVLRLRYGLEDGEDYTLEQVGEKLGLTRERIRQIQSQALRRLRHPSRSRNLKPFLN
ncbi:MAG TPA: sigma-70 family RNA polymerase sigma factor [Chloroflexi bacterium]|nr:sigma-70 family RNA polymerase sigma factor [Chloroflexota bacterium]